MGLRIAELRLDNRMSPVTENRAWHAHMRSAKTNCVFSSSMQHGSPQILMPLS